MGSAGLMASDQAQRYTGGARSWLTSVKGIYHKWLVRRPFQTIQGEKRLNFVFGGLRLE